MVNLSLQLRDPEKEDTEDPTKVLPSKAFFPTPLLENKGESEGGGGVDGGQTNYLSRLILICDHASLMFKGNPDSVDLYFPRSTLG